MVAKGSYTFLLGNPQGGADKLPGSSCCLNRECFLFILETKKIIQRNADKLLLKESHGMFLSDRAVHFLRFLFTIHLGKVTSGDAIVTP